MPGLQLRQLLRGVIDERGEFGALGAGQFICQHAVYFFLDDTRGVAEDVRERVGLAVQVAHEMLGGFGQAQDRL